jgi:hypothetical protein
MTEIDSFPYNFTFKGFPVNEDIYFDRHEFVNIDNENNTGTNNIDTEIETTQQISETIQPIQANITTQTEPNAINIPLTEIKQKTKEPKTKEPIQLDIKNFNLSHFYSKNCSSGVGGWKITEIKAFCRALGIDDNGNTKQILCDRINSYIKENNLKENNLKENNLKETITKNKEPILGVLTIDNFDINKCSPGRGGYKTEQLIQFARTHGISTNDRSKERLCYLIKKFLQQKEKTKSPKNKEPILGVLTIDNFDINKCSPGRGGYKTEQLIQFARTHGISTNDRSKERLCYLIKKFLQQKEKETTEKETTEKETTEKETTEKEKDTFKKNIELFEIKDCGGGGDCQFLSLAHALSSGTGKQYTNEILRKMIAEYILKTNNEQFTLYLNTYKREKDENRFVGKWNPYNIQSRQELADIIKTTGFTFEGDDISASILSKILKIDIGFVYINEKRIYIHLNPENDRIILLLYIPLGNSGHYQLLGYNHQYMFFKKSLPNPVKQLIIHSNNTTSEQEISLEQESTSDQESTSEQEITSEQESTSDQESTSEQEITSDQESTLEQEITLDNSYVDDNKKSNSNELVLLSNIKLNNKNELIYVNTHNDTSDDILDDSTDNINNITDEITVDTIYTIYTEDTIIPKERKLIYRHLID